MKLSFKHCFNSQPQQIIAALVLSGIFSVSGSLMLIKPAISAPGTVDATQSGKPSDRTNNLPRSVANAVLQDLSRREGIPTAKLKIIEFSRETWSGGCLGLAQPDEICTLAIVAGWRVVVTDGSQTWIYRTDSTGQNIRLESQNAATDLPQAVADAALQDAAQQLNVPVSSLQIIQAEQREWSDSCLGLGGPEVLCAAVVVPGWLVTIASGQQRLVYRTNESGSVVVLDEAASSVGDADTIQPISIPKSQIPPALKSRVIFRAISSGGILGQTIETNLRGDGQLIQVRVNHFKNTSQSRISRISRQQVQQFLQVLEQQQFAQFNNLEFLPPSNAADYITVTFSNRAGTTRYTDIAQDRLPKQLQAVILAWEQLLGKKR